MALTPKQQRFVDEYLVDFNATQAATRCGYSAKTAKQQGSRLLTNADISKAVEDRKKALADKFEIKREQVLRELARIGFANAADLWDEHDQLRDLRTLDEDLQRAVASKEITDSGTKVKLWDKPKALELLGKHLGLFDEKVQHEHNVTISVVDPYAEQAKPKGSK